MQRGCGTLKEKYRAFEIYEDEAKETVIEGSLSAIAEYVKGCREGSIITIHTPEGEPFLLSLSRMFLYCEDKAFLNERLIPYLRSSHEREKDQKTRYAAGKNTLNEAEM